MRLRGKPLHVLQVSPSIERPSGGPVTALEGLARALLRRGHRVTVAAPSGRGETIAADLFDAGATLVTWPATPRFPAGWHPDAGRVLDHAVAACDVVHVRGVWEQPLARAAAAARAAGKPYLVEPSGMLDPWCLGHHAWRKRLAWLGWTRTMMRGADAVYAASRCESRNLSRLCPEERIFVAPIGTDLAIGAPPLEARGGAGPYILFLGRLSAKKGVDLLVRAFAASAARETHELIFAGPAEGRYDRVVLETSAATGVRDRVRVLGPVWGDAKRRLLAEASTFALLSRHENFAIAAAEALAMGVPVVLSQEIGLAHDLPIRPFVKVVPLDATVAARALDELSARDAPRAAWRLEAARLSAELFDWDRVAGLVEK